MPRYRCVLVVVAEVAVRPLVALMKPEMTMLRRQQLRVRLRAQAPRWS